MNDPTFDKNWRRFLQEGGGQKDAATTPLPDSGWSEDDRTFGGVQPESPDEASRWADDEFLPAEDTINESPSVERPGAPNDRHGGSPGGRKPRLEDRDVIDRLGATSSGRKPSSSGRKPSSNPGNAHPGDDWPKQVPEGRSLIGRRDQAVRQGPQLPSGLHDQSIQARERFPVEYAPPSAYAEPPPDDFRIDLKKYLWLAIKHRWLILGSAVLFLFGGLILTLLTTPIYRATSTIQIDRNTDNVVNVENFQQSKGGSDVEFYQTQYELLRSRALAERVASNLSLQDDPAFLAADAPPPWTRLRRLIFGQPEAPIGSDVDVVERQRAAGGRVLGGLSVTPVRSSSIVQLSFDSPNPQLAKKVVDAVADGFITVNLERRYESSAYARTFLEERLQQLKIKLEESEKESVAYAEAKGIVTTGDSSNQTLSMANLTAANEDLSESTTERLRAELLLQQIESAVDLAVPKILENKSIETMRAKRVELETEYQDKLSFFKPGFPEMKQLEAQINEINRQIAQEINLIRDSVRGQFEAAKREEAKLAERVEELKAEVTDFRNRNIQYNILQREVDTNRSLYDGLLQRYKEIGVAGGVGTNNVSIVDYAQVPGAAYTPRLSRSLMTSLFLGLMIGGALAFAREHFDDTFKSPEELEENLGLPLLGIIPRVKNAGSPNSFVDDPRSAPAEAFRSLRTAVQFSTSEGAPRVLLIASSRPGEGKSTTALTLAKNFAHLGMRVLLIDADLRKPSLQGYLEESYDVGLTHYLSGSASPPEVFQSVGVDGLTFMPSGPIPPNPAELLAGPRMLSLLTIAAQKFDLVIIDGPPVSGLADAPLLSSMAAGTLLVVDVGATGRGIARAALKRLHFARAQMIGVVANKIDMSARGYGYGYGYGYGAGDQSYYGVEKPVDGAKKPAEIADSRKQ